MFVMNVLKYYKFSILFHMIFGFVVYYFTEENPNPEELHTIILCTIRKYNVDVAIAGLVNGLLLGIFSPLIYPVILYEQIKNML